MHGYSAPHYSGPLAVCLGRCRGKEWYAEAFKRRHESEEGYQHAAHAKKASDPCSYHKCCPYIRSGYLRGIIRYAEVAKPGQGHNYQHDRARKICAYRRLAQYKASYYADGLAYAARHPKASLPYKLEHKQQEQQLKAHRRKYHFSRGHNGAKRLC